MTKLTTPRWVSDIDMQMSRLEPGLHNISVRTLNNDGESPGELSFVTYETYEVVVLTAIQQTYEINFRSPPQPCLNQRQQ